MTLIAVFEGLALAGVVTLASTAALAAPVGDALDRPSIMVRAPERAVLLGAASAGGRIVAVGERGLITLSDDGGRSWRQAVSPTSVTLTAVQFASESHGYAIGHGGTVLTTDDGGEHWVRRLDGRRIAQLILGAANSSGDEKSVRDAQRLVADGPDKPLLDLLVRADRRVVVVGAYGYAFASDDGGATWTSWMARIPNPKGLHLYTVRQSGTTLLIAGEQGLVVLSRDEGRSFTAISTPYKGSFFTAEMLGEQDFILAGLRGTALRSIDGGTTWSPLVTPMPVSITASAVSSDGRLLATNQAGIVMALQGDRLQPIIAAPLPPLNGLLLRPGGVVLALTVQGVISLPTESGPVK